MVGQTAENRGVNYAATIFPSEAARNYRVSLTYWMPFFFHQPCQKRRFFPMHFKRSILFGWPPKKRVKSWRAEFFVSDFFKKYLANLGLTFHSFRVPFLCVQRNQKHTTFLDFLVVAKGSTLNETPFFCSFHFLFREPISSTQK